jgi:ABC-type uncharacterized transport system permease subunit
MSTETASKSSHQDESYFADQRRAALGYVLDAFAEGKVDGLDGDCLAHAALFSAFKELVDTYGEEPVAEFAQRLPERVRAGEFSVVLLKN